MATLDSKKQDQLGRAILLTLRLTVALQCLGNWRWLIQIQETPLLHWMLDPTDIGGLGLSEQTALAIQQSVGWLLPLAAAVVIWRPQPLVLATLVVLQTLIAVAMWRIADGYSLQASWLPPPLLTLFPFATQALRIVAPLSLGILTHNSATWRTETKSPSQYSVGGARRLSGTGEITGSGAYSNRVHQVFQLMRWAAAIVFLAHGVEAVQLNPRFVDLIIGSAQCLFGLSFSEASAERYLAAIGIIDILVAAACMGCRWVAVMWWMAFWGGVTALSRMVAYGGEASSHEVLTRAPHLGVPLAVVLWWHLLKSNQTRGRTVHENQEFSKGDSEDATV